MNPATRYSRLITRAAVVVGFLIPLLPRMVLSAETTATAPVVAHIDSLWTHGQRDAALSLLASELPRARAAADSGTITNLLVMKGAYHNFLGDGRTAETALREGVALARTRRDSTLLLAGVRWLGLAVGSQGRREEAMALYEELLDLGERQRDLRHQGWALIGLAWANWRGGAAETALTQYERAVGLFARTDDVQGQLWANNGVAALNNDMGRYDKAASGYQATIRVARANNRPQSEAVALNNLGTLEYSLGRHDAAMGCFEQALLLQEGQRNQRQKLTPMFNISLCQKELGQGAAARQTLTEALALCEQYSYRDLRSSTLVMMANLEIEQGRFHQAEILLQEAVSDPGTAMVKDVVDARIALAEAYRQQGVFKAAERELALADSALGDSPFPYARLRLQRTHARIWQDQGDTRQALDGFLALAADAQEKGLSQFHLEALSEAADAYRLLGNRKTARAFYETAAVSWENDRQLLLTPRWREQHGASGRRIFADLAAVICAEGDTAGAFDRMQTYKSRTLLERMLGPGEALNDSLSAEGRRVQLRELQTDVLRTGELFLDYILGPRTSLLFAVTRDTVLVRQLPASAEISARARAYFDLLRRPDAGSPEALTAVGNRLKGMLLPDLLQVISGSKRVVVAADAPLNLLPFADLAEPGSQPDWVRVPSASVLSRMRQTDSGGRMQEWRTLAVASGWSQANFPLSGARREVAVLARSYRDVTARVLTGTESKLPRLAGFDILHLAAHASNDDQSPWQSSIHFLPDEQGGLLRAVDVLNLELDAKLAVLSSCSSGGGRILSGEGVLGLSTAFLSAGVPTVVASLWAVDDGATARFMQLFYEFLAAGQDGAHALSSAQQELRSSPETRHPYYWAGFVLIGEGAVQPRLVRTRGWIVPASLGLLFGSLLWSALLARRP